MERQSSIVHSWFFLAREIEMKKVFLTFAAILVAWGANAQVSLADHHDHWFKRYDHDGDGRWNYPEYRAAQRDWWYRHHANPWQEYRLNREFSRWDRDRDRRWRPEEAAGWHRHYW